MVHGIHGETIPIPRSSSPYQDFPPCPECKKKDRVVRAGTRDSATGPVQRFLCRRCMKKFIHRTLPRTSYPASVIITALTTYNMGHTYEQTAKIVSKRFHTKIPVATLQKWTKRYTDTCTFIPLRKKYDIKPEDIIQTRRFHHGQPYDLKVHMLKLNRAAKSFPTLRAYILHLLNDQKPIDPTIFDKGDRCSAIAKENRIEHIQLPKVQSKGPNQATRMTELALTLARTANERHEKVEHCFLANDYATVATEIPVYLLKEECKAVCLPIESSIGGHIDMLQVRRNKVFIMDYKPEAKTQDNAVAQLWLYANLLSTRIGIPLSDMVCAWFDEKDYFEFKP